MHKYKVGQAWQYEDKTCKYVIKSLIESGYLVLITERIEELPDCEVTYDFTVVNTAMEYNALPGNNHLNNMNKYNIKEGDKYKTSIYTFTVGKVTNEGFNVHNDDGRLVCFYSFTEFNPLVEKGSKILLTKETKGKIVGYTLLKDTPDNKAGAVFSKKANGDYGLGIFSYLPQNVEGNTEWFAPIYEEVKPTEVRVQTSLGQVKVTAEKISINDNDYIYTEDFHTFVKVIEKATNTRLKYNISVETFKVGCKTFHVNDIPKLEAAIKQVS